MARDGPSRRRQARRAAIAASWISLPISRADQDRYLAEQVDAAELLGVPRCRVRDSVDAYREYFASVLSELRTSPDAETAISFVRRPSLPRLPHPLRLVLQPAFMVMGDAATGLVPSSLRPLAGLPPSGPRELPSRVAIAAATNAVAAASQVPLLRYAVEEPLTRTLGTRKRRSRAAA